MKKLFLLSAIAILLIMACSKNESVDVKDQRSNKELHNTIRSLDEVFQITQASIKILESSSSTRTIYGRQIAPNKTKVCRRNTKTRSGTDTKDTLLYIVNFENNEGFAVIAAPTNVEPLMAITESGNYDPDEPTEIEGFNMFIMLAKKYVEEQSRKNEMRPLDPYSWDEYCIIHNDTIGPYVTVTWGQRYTEGYRCSNDRSGCTNTALAQIISYYQYPDSITLTYPGHDIAIQSLNWTDIKAHPTTHSYYACNTPDIHDATSRFFRQLGKLTLSTYHPTNQNDTIIGTETLDSNVCSALWSLGYQTGGFSNVYNKLNITTHLDSEHLFYLSGRSTSTLSVLGHGWVLDGYANVLMTHNRYVYEDDEWILILSEVIDEFLVHYNWGWYGNCNGYFNGNVYDCQAGVDYDDNSNHSANNSFYNVLYLPVYR